MELYFNKNYITWVLLVSLTAPQLVSGDLVPAPAFANPYEKYTNQTIDQLITTSLGGMDLAANQILDFGENILAELDMFLTKEQFLNMYQPPEPEEMYAMGMMPAPEGTSYDSERKNFFAPPLHKKRQKRKAVRDTTLRWSDGVMPYKFARGHFENKEEYMMRRAMTEWERYTCVRFRPATNSDKNSVQFQNGVGCNSQLGMVGGIQMLNLQAPGCRYKGLYLHEIGHALGLVHEHQLPDRDSFIRINYDNVSPHMRIWFNKYTREQVDQKEVPYQLSSVMHYGITAFSKDGKSQTIEAIDRNKEDRIGRVYLKELAYTDVNIVNKMYHCADHCPDQTKCGSRGHLDQNCNCLCKDGSSDCDRTKGERTDNCRNEYASWACYIWANQGECDKNPLYMNKYCAKACHICDGDQVPEGSCKDKYKEDTCQLWKDRGECVANQGWMSRNCKATCNLCEGDKRPEVECQNKETNEKCEKWAKAGECEVNPNWMFKNCQKSCWKCDKDGTDTGSTGGGVDEDKLECKDTHDNCQKWASSGECKNNPDWMINNCRKSCQKCDDGKCKNLYDDTRCEIWEQKLECLSNSDWMNRQCAKACGTGVCSNTDGGGGGGGTGTTKGSSTRPKTTTPPTSGSCKNVHNSDTQCEIWAKNDHCSINPSWMLKNCAKACDKCTDVHDRTKTTTPKTRTKTTDANGGKELPGCVDTNSQCGTWAKHGFCDKNPRYNLIYCKKSCNNCNGCRDTEVLCSVWAEAGYCAQNARYMLRHCQKSCKACTSYAKLDDLKPTDLTQTTTGSPNSSLQNNFSIVLLMFIILLGFLNI